MNKFSSTILYAIMLFFTVATVAILVSSWSGFTQLQQNQNLKDVRYSSIGAVINKVSKELGITPTTVANDISQQSITKATKKLAKPVVINTNKVTKTKTRTVSTNNNRNNRSLPPKVDKPNDDSDEADETKNDNDKNKGDK